MQNIVMFEIELRIKYWVTDKTLEGKGSNQGEPP